MKYTTLMLALCFPFFAPVAGAQEVVRNEEGRSIVVFPDGSWQYFEPGGTGEVWAGKAEIFGPDAQELQANRDRFEDAKHVENQLALELIRARLERVTIEQELAEMLDIGKTFPLQTKILIENRLANVKERQEKLSRDYDLAKKRSLILRQIMHLPPGVYDKKLADWENEHLKKGQGITTSDSRLVGRIDKKKYRGYDPAADVMLNPPPPPCEAVFEGQDPSGGKRVDMQAAPIFFRTDPALQTYFQQSDFITGQGYLTRISGGFRAFTLQVMVATQRAPELFGVFKQGEFIELQLLDGNVVRLFNQLNDPGRWEPAAKFFVYTAQFGIGQKDEKLLRSSELDFVRVRWSKVQEEFPVYELDFFKRQFDCMDSYKGF